MPDIYVARTSRLTPGSLAGKIARAYRIVTFCCRPAALLSFHHSAVPSGSEVPLGERASRAGLEIALEPCGGLFVGEFHGQDDSQGTVPDESSCVLTGRAGASSLIRSIVRIGCNSMQL